MQDESRRRDARMMEAVAALAGRSASSSEIDLRLGLAPSTAGFPKWIGVLVKWLICARPAKKLSIERDRSMATEAVLHGERQGGQKV